MAPRAEMSWHDDRLYHGRRLSGYSIIRDERYPPKDAAMAMLARDIAAQRKAAEASGDAPHSRDRANSRAAV
jgi:hypothetical protein